MAHALNIDTLKFARRLTDAGVEQKHAEAIVEGLRDLDTSEIATKSDILALKNDIQRMESNLTIRFGMMLATGIGLLVALDRLFPALQP